MLNGLVMKRVPDHLSLSYNPKQSVLNRRSQSHDRRNLFIVDGAGFTSAGGQKPTMTILSLSVRASEYLVGEMSKKNI